MRIDLTSIASGSIVVFVGKIISAGCQYLLILLMGRFLGPTEVGLFFLGRATMSLANIGAMLGLEGSLPKFIPEYLTKKKYGKILEIIKFAFSSTFLLSILIAVLLYVLTDHISVYAFNDRNLIPVIKLFAFCLPIFTFLKILIASLRSFRDMIGLTLVENIIIPGGTIIVTAALFFLYTQNVRSVILGFCISILLSIIVGFYFLIKRLPEREQGGNDSLSWGAILNYSLPLMGTGVLGFFLMWTDTFMLGIFKTSAEVGIYNGAARIAFFSSIILGSVNMIFGPTIAALYSEENTAHLVSSYKNTVRWIIHISLPIYLAIFFFSNKIMGLYGSSFEQGALALIILSVGQLINISVGSAGYLLTMTGRPKVEFFNTVISVISNFVLNLSLIPIMGITGAAIATAVSLFLVNLLRVLENYHYLKLHPFSLQIIWPFKIK